MKKIILIFGLLSLFSTYIFSQPGGGPGGPGGGQGPSAPGGGGGPSSPHSAPPSHGNPPPPPPGGRGPGGSSGGSYGSSSGGSSSSYQVINFTGMRKYSVPEALEVSGTEILTHKNGINFVIHFNQSVDVANLNVNSIFINGKNPESDVKIKFNRKADSVTLLISDGYISEVELKNASVRITDIQTFDGKYLEELIVK